MELLAIIGSCTVLSLPLLKELRQQKRRAASGANRLDHMTEQQFEAHLETTMRKLGYRVERTRPIGEGQASSSSPAFIISTNGMKIAVRTKHDGQPVDIHAIQAAITTQEKYGCSDTMIVSNSDISASIHTLARNSKVILWAKNDIIKAGFSIKHQAPQEVDTRQTHRESAGDYFANPQQYPA